MQDFGDLYDTITNLHPDPNDIHNFEKEVILLQYNDIYSKSPNCCAQNLQYKSISYN